jgi:hypothetical protein
MSNACFTSSAEVAATRATYEENLKSANFAASNCDASYNDLLAENALLKSKLKDSQKFKNDGFGQEEKAQTVPIFYIAIIYIILYFILGLFYNQMLTQSVASIMTAGITGNYADTWNQVDIILNKYRFILFIFVFLLLFTVNIGFIYILILKGTNTKYAMKAVSIAILAVTGVTFLLTNNINFVKIFENTIGYSIASFFPPVTGQSFTDFMNTIFQHKHFQNGVDFGFLFTVFRLDNFGDVIKDIGYKDIDIQKYDFEFTKEADKSFENLAKCVIMKNTVGHFCWIIFSSIATTMISIKFMSKNL